MCAHQGVEVLCGDTCIGINANDACAPSEERGEHSEEDLFSDVSEERAGACAGIQHNDQAHEGGQCRRLPTEGRGR
eukprot:3381383-Prorocentrum_lima.AAC.1